MATLISEEVKNPLVKPVESRPSVNERCDACSARAAWVVLFPGSSELAWCNHHYTRFSKSFEDKVTVKLTFGEG